MGMKTIKLNARTAKTIIGHTVSHDGQDLRIEDVRHMGRGGWMLFLSSGALLRPSELR